MPQFKADVRIKTGQTTRWTPVVVEARDKTDAALMIEAMYGVQSGSTMTPPVAVDQTSTKMTVPATPVRNTSTPAHASPPSPPPPPARRHVEAERKLPSATEVTGLLQKEVEDILQEQDELVDDLNEIWKRLRLPGMDEQTRMHAEDEAFLRFGSYMKTVGRLTEAREEIAGLKPKVAAERRREQRRRRLVRFVVLAVIAGVSWLAWGWWNGG